MSRSVYRIGFDSDRLIKCNAWNNIQLVNLLTHKSQCWVGLCTGLVIWVQVNQSLPVNNCRQAMITSSYWLHVASDLASNHPAFAMYHMSSRETVGNITIGCLSLSLREQTCVNNTRATLTFTPYRYCLTGNPLLVITSHVGIREFNCGIILTGTSVRQDPYPVSEVEAEITCPTFSDVISCATQAETFTELECTMTAECTHIVAWVTRYCQSWRLKPSTSKTVSSVFHLQNTYANRQLSVIMNGETLKHDPYPAYLGVTLDRTLTYEEHTSKTAAKFKSRNSFSKLPAHHGALMPKFSAHWPSTCATQSQSTVVQHGQDPVTRHPSTANLTTPCIWSQGVCGPPRFHSCQCWPI